MAKKFYGKHFHVSETISSGLRNFFGTVDPKAREKGLAALGLQLLNNVVVGSPGEGSRPPILTGRLRGSGSVFVGSKRIGDTLFMSSEGSPAQSYTESNKNIVTAGFNTPYAARMHEHMSPHGTPDPIIGKTFQAHRDADAVSGKFVERHLKADKTELFQLYTDIYKKEAGT